MGGDDGALGVDERVDGGNERGSEVVEEDIQRREKNKGRGERSQ